MSDTVLDQAAAAMDADEAARLRFYETLADAMLFVLLEREASGDSIDLRVIEADGHQLAVGFDSEARLADFAGEAAFAEIPGRVLAGMLGHAGLGLALNPGVSAHPAVLPAEALQWLVAALDEVAPDDIEARIDTLLPPRDVPEAVLTALDGKLARAGGLAQAAYLAATRGPEGVPGHLLGFVGADDGAEPALARAVNEALAFSGLEAGFLDVGFFAADAPIVAQLARVALRFDLAPAETPARPAPGSDPAKPPRLR